MAYLSRSNLLFVKRFPVYPERPYGDLVAATVSVWYYKDRLCEIEPIGPQERLAPGASASFTEEWWALPFEFPAHPDRLDLGVVADLVQRHTSSEGPDLAPRS
jgi:hypothetical protein